MKTTNPTRPAKHSVGPAASASTDARAWHALASDQALEALESQEGGLVEAEAAERLRRFGPNRLTIAPPTPWWVILARQFRGLVSFILLAAAVGSFLLGEPLEAAAIAAVLAINAGFGFVTELRARRAMDSLLTLDVHRAVVIRGGRRNDIEAADLVPGDHIGLEEGDTVPADVRLLEDEALSINEAVLTGESVPVLKDSSARLAPGAAMGDRRNLAFKGTGVVRGFGIGVVTATGDRTEVGRIGALLRATPDELTPLERRLDSLGRRLVGLTLVVATVVTGLGVLRGMDLGLMVKTGVALAIAAVPEGLPAVATIALAYGLRNMARRRALVRRLPAVEALGSATVICTDKTGTLTAGVMTASVVVAGEIRYEATGTPYGPDGAILGPDGEPLSEVPSELDLLLRIVATANRADLTPSETGWTARGDPTDAALLGLALKAGLVRSDVLAGAPVVDTIPFASDRMYTAVLQERDGTKQWLAKGAPGRILQRCAGARRAGGRHPLSDADRQRLTAANDELAEAGLRVIGIAVGPESCGRDDLSELDFVGFVGLIDPPAEGVRETAAGFRAAGIRTVMVTGDQRRTAEAVAREIGVLQPDEEAIESTELVRLDASELAARLPRIAVFSRVEPEHKVRIVRAYQQAGEVVAMLGDGVNDAVALRAADVGVAMGGRGSDVAKEAADVVLQDDRFATVGEAIREGRVIYDNIRKFVFYLFSCNLAEVLVLMVTSLLGLPLPLLPLQILWLNLVTDTFPALALATEPADPGVMLRPPVRPEEAILSRRLTIPIGLYAALITAVTLVAFGIGGPAEGEAGARAMTLAFSTLAFAQIFHLGNARSSGAVLRPRRAVANRWALGAVALAAALQVLAVEAPALQRLLGTTHLEAADWTLVLGLAVIPALVGQSWKVARSRGTRSDTVVE